MLFRDPEQILAGHEIPTHGRLTSRVGAPIPQLQCLQRRAPATLRMLQIAEGGAGLPEKDVIVIDLAGGLELGAQTQVSPQHGQCARTQLNAAVFAGFRLIAIDAEDASFVHTDDAVREIEVREDEGDLLRRSQSREKSKLVIVALRGTPVTMNGGDQRFCILYGEGIEFGSVTLPKSNAPQVERGVVVEGSVSIAEVEGALQDTDGVVVGLFTPGVVVRDGDERRVPDL